MDRRTAIKTFAGGGAFVLVCDINGAPRGADYHTALNFDVDTFTGTITEPDGTVNNLSGYHGTGTLPPLGGEPCVEHPPSGCQTDADVVLSGALDFPQGFTVPAGQVWEFDPTTDTTVRSGGNIVVNGTLRAVPGPNHRITFYGINEANIVGGGMMPLVTDVGLWVDGGVLDISGVPKQAWNRTGQHHTWSATDELLVMPATPGAYIAAPFAGDPPTASTVRRNAGSSQYDIQRSYTSEVCNMSRSFTIEAEGGRAHVMIINATSPQRLEYAKLSNLGPTGKLGRYPLHVHMNGDGTDGSAFRGNVAVGCGNHAFVTHASSGCDHTDSIAYKTTGHAFWWDENDETDRVRWDRCGAIGTIDGSGFQLGEGIGNSCVDSFAVGTRANSANAGFLWPSQANGDRNLWAMDSCVAHNNDTHGFRAWQNDSGPHSIVNCVAYMNAREGFSHGAYSNRYGYHRCVAFGNVDCDFAAHALGHWTVRDCWLERVTLRRHTAQDDSTLILFSSTWSYPIGSVALDEQDRFAGRFHFESRHRNADLSPSDFTRPGVQLSTVDVVNGGRSSFTLTP